MFTLVNGMIKWTTGGKLAGLIHLSMPYVLVGIFLPLTVPIYVYYKVKKYSKPKSIRGTVRPTKV